MSRLLERWRSPPDRRIRYALYRSYVLLSSLPIELISGGIPDQVPLGKAQRLGGQAYESPALPLSYSAVPSKLIERDLDRQPPPFQHITIEQHIPIRAAVAAIDRTTIRCEGIFAAHSPWPAGIRARSADPQR